MTRSGRLQRAPILGPDVRDEVLRGLRADVKTIAPKYFYDDRGSWLFERICEQPEYYLTRTELEILRTCAPEIGALAGPRCALVEYGSGAGVKIRLLLDALEAPASYTPVDISRRQLSEVAATLQHDYPTLAIRPVYADYTRPLDIPPLPVRARRVGFFPGSSIGNFHPPEATAFLRRVAQTLGRDGAIVLGVDRRKDAQALHAAYNDACGVTAEFNLNVLTRLNRELGATFDLSLFRHRAFFDEATSRIEMHLESRASHWVTIAGEQIHFDTGETIWTESSYKYDADRLRDVVTAAGFEITRLWTDPCEQFWVVYLGVNGESQVTTSATKSSVRQNIGSTVAMDSGSNSMTTAVRGDIVPLTANRREHLERRLRDERARALGDLNRVLGGLSDGNEQESAGHLTTEPFHMADRGSGTIESEIAAPNATRESRELGEIDTALERLRRPPERYGICEDTGREIPFERLNDIPWARTCDQANADMRGESRTNTSEDWR